MIPDTDPLAALASLKRRAEKLAAHAVCTRCDCTFRILRTREQLGEQILRVASAVLPEDVAGLQVLQKFVLYAAFELAGQCPNCCFAQAAEMLAPEVRPHSEGVHPKLRAVPNHD